MAEVVLASDPSYADHDPGLSAASGAMVDGRNWHLQGGLIGKNPLDGGI